MNSLAEGTREAEWEMRKCNVEMGKWGKSVGEKWKGRTLFWEEVVALEARAEAIEGLAGLADPKSDGVESSAQGSHSRVVVAVVLVSVVVA